VPPSGINIFGLMPGGTWWLNQCTSQVSILLWRGSAQCTRNCDTILSYINFLLLCIQWWG